MNVLTKKSIGTFVVLLMLASGIAYSTTSAEAKKEVMDKITAKTYSGIVQDFSRNKLTIKTHDGKTVHLKTDKNTKFNDDISEDDDIDIVTSGDGKKAKNCKKHDKPRYGHDNRDNDHNNRDHDKDKGKKNGYDDGYKDGRDNKGDHQDNDDYKNGHSNDYKDGYKKGYEDGYKKGQEDYQKEHGNN